MGSSWFAKGLAAAGGSMQDIGSQGVRANFKKQRDQYLEKWKADREQRAYDHQSSESAANRAFQGEQGSLNRAHQSKEGLLSRLFKSSEADKSRGFQSEQGVLTRAQQVQDAQDDRAFQLAILELENDLKSSGAGLGKASWTPEKVSKHALATARTMIGADNPNFSYEKDTGQYIGLLAQETESLVRQQLAQGLSPNFNAAATQAFSKLSQMDQHNQALNNTDGYAGDGVLLDNHQQIADEFKARFGPRLPSQEEAVKHLVATTGLSLQGVNKVLEKVYAAPQPSAQWVPVE